MARLTPKKFKLSAGKFVELQDLIKQHKTPQQTVRRSQIIPLVSEGKNHLDIGLPYRQIMR